MISKFYSKQKSLGVYDLLWRVNWGFGGLHAMGGILGGNGGGGAEQGEGFGTMGQIQTQIVKN